MNKKVAAAPKTRKTMVKKTMGKKVAVKPNVYGVSHGRDFTQPKGDKKEGKKKEKVIVETYIPTPRGPKNPKVVKCNGKVVEDAPKPTKTAKKKSEVKITVHRVREDGTVPGLKKPKKVHAEAKTEILSPGEREVLKKVHVSDKIVISYKRYKAPGTLKAEQEKQARLNNAATTKNYSKSTPSPSYEIVMWSPLKGLRGEWAYTKHPKGDMPTCRKFIRENLQRIRPELLQCIPIGMDLGNLKCPAGRLPRPFDGLRNSD